METQTRPAFNKRNVAKFITTYAVSTAVGLTVSRLLKNNFPQTEAMHVADLAGGLSGWYVSAKTQHITDKFVDDSFDALEERQRKSSLQTP
jgi:hypothetical protein